MVANRGAPIDAALLPRLFDRFYRADPARREGSSEHAGLGLAILEVILPGYIFAGFAVAAVLTGGLIWLGAVILLGVMVGLMIGRVVNGDPPPFFASEQEAQAASSRKWANLGKVAQGHQRNFAGQQHELWCDGGELKFVSRMITQSQLFKPQVCWFSSLVSQQKHLAPLQKLLRSVGVVQSEVIEMRQGQKVSRILAWSFLSTEQQQYWCRETA